jgi:hypothetical protein
MENRGLNTLPFAHSPEFASLSASLTLFGQAIGNMPENKLLKAL